MLVMILAFYAGSQNAACNGTRYKSYTFPSIDSTMAVQYGSNTTIGNNNKNLSMDIYYPKNDVATARPLIVFAFGGSFVSGNRTDMQPICRYFAHQGYIAATIDYRLIDAFITDSFALVDEVIKATHDMKAAIRYFREDAHTSNIYKVDTNYIFAGGISSGGFMANHVAYLDPSDNIPAYIQTAINNNGGFEGTSSTNTQYSSKVHGVLNYSGAIGRAEWIGSNNPPLYSAHDDGDGVVPCPKGLSPGNYPLNVTTYGSCAMEPAANAAGITNSFYEIVGSTGHVSYFSGGTNADGFAILQQSSDFLYDIVCASVGVEESSKNELAIFPNPASTSFTINPSHEGNYNLSIFTIDGQLVEAKNNLNGTTDYDISHLAEGVFIVKAVFSDKMVATTKLIKE